MRARILEAIKERPVLTGGTGALLGAIVVWVITDHGESEKQTTEILHQLTAISHQTTVVMDRQEGFLQQLETVGIRLEAIEARNDALADDLTELKNHQTALRIGQTRLSEEVATLSVEIERVDYGDPAAVIAETAKEIMVMQREGVPGVWIQRGPPYARTDVLEARLGRPVSADERDQAAAAVLIRATTLQRRGNYE